MDANKTKEKNKIIGPVRALVQFTVNARHVVALTKKNEDRNLNMVNKKGENKKALGKKKLLLAHMHVKKMNSEK